ncbi:MAG: hypothetical protein COY78_03950 [Candidatus Omnitrophica bacterium CG_4_10_14_0_8_um_filter_44_12]|nr:MAG: hypothetical protein COY78_03950 [Candidatus Omnitrophica bacterium CG_4_10_14_0_8_um_filter_44_12]
MTQFEFQRRLKNIKQIELAKIMGLSSEYISAVERRLVKPSNNFKRQAARALGLPQDFLFSNLSCDI